VVFACERMGRGDCAAIIENAAANDGKHAASLVIKTGAENSRS